MVQRQEKKILQCLKRVLGDEEEKKTRNRALSESLRQIKKSWSTVEVLHAEFSFFSFLSLSVSWGAWVSERWYFCHKLWEEVNVRPPPHRFYVLITPLLGSCLGRQGSSGSGSWANTESSPEEQVLLESWQVGEYCSKGTDRSRYSCQRKCQRLDSGVTVKLFHFLVVKWVEKSLAYYSKSSEYEILWRCCAALHCSLACNFKNAPKHLKNLSLRLFSSVFMVGWSNKLPVLLFLVLCVFCSFAGRLTSVEVIDKIRSWSSTSCRKVGLCDGTACQHSLMIMYLESQQRGFSHTASRSLHSPILDGLFLLFRFF